jgi:hypothetical protein
MMTEAEMEQAFALLTKMAENATDYIQRDRSKTICGEEKL